MENAAPASRKTLANKEAPQPRAKISTTLFDVYERSLILRVHFSRGVSGNVHPYSLCKSRPLNGSGVPRKTEFSDVRSERSLDLFIFTGATLSRVGRTTVQFNTKVLGPSIFMSDYIIRKNYLPLR